MNKFKEIITERLWEWKLLIRRRVDSFLHFFKSIYIGIKNIIEYLPLIYQDRDWDYSFFIYLLHFKIQRMEKYFENANIIVDSKDVAEEIRRVRENLDELIAIEEGVQKDFSHEGELEQKKVLLEELGLEISENLFKWWD